VIASGVLKRGGAGHDGGMAVSAVESRVGWAMSGASAGILGFWVVLGGPAQLGQQGLRNFLETEYGNVVFALLFPFAGAILLARDSKHRLGLLYCLSGLACSVTLAAGVYAERGLVERPGSLPGALAAGWVSSWVWMCGFVPLMTLGVLSFPDGRLPSRRWWPVAAGVALTLALGVGGVALRQGPLENHPARDNPLGLPMSRAWVDVLLEGVWIWLVLISIVLSFAALVARYRHAPAAERDRYHWFLVAIALFLGAFVIPPEGPTGIIGNLLIVVATPLLPLSVLVAIRRSRLPRAAEEGLRRSFVYCWLLAAELAVYAAVVVPLDAVLRGQVQPLAGLSGAAAVAVLYQPLRLRLQQSAGHMLYGERGDPYEVLAGLGRRLEAVGSADAALPATVAAIADALRLPYVAIELPGDPAATPTAAHGSPSGATLLPIALTHGGENVGRLLVARQSPSDLTSDDRRLLEDLARQVAGATHAVLLDRALRRSRDRLVLAREDERGRLRQDLHDGLGPAMAGLALGLAAARNLLRADPGTAAGLLRELEDETLGCVGEIRRILDGLRPPALDQLGLLPALAAFAGRLSSRDEALSVTVEAVGPLPELTADVEVAAYRIATEAMTNVARHAHARSCQLVVTMDEELVLQVSDDGIGLPLQRRTGAGLPSMTERATRLGGRCTIGQRPTGGTVVSARLPVGSA
jgi:signal transduction histidine kinase